MTIMPEMASRMKVRMFEAVAISPDILMPTKIKTVARIRSQIRQTVMRENVTRIQTADGLEDGVIHRAVADALVEFFSVGPDERDHHGVDEAEDTQQGDQLAKPPTAEGCGIAEDNVEAE